MGDKSKARRDYSPFTYAVAAALTFAVGFVAVYVTLGRPDNGPRTAPPAPASTAATSLPKGPGTNPLSTGEMAAFVFKREPEALPDITFADGESKSRTLKDWTGKVVLLNLWATWCAPCRKEMPSLDRLQKALGSDRFEVMALAVDRTGAESAKKFLDGIKVESLRLYVDASARSGSTLKAPGLPTTILIGKDGREIGRLVGPAEWDSADAKRLIEAALK
jgi:thiol-disulfide isomerase/thioredoxin